MYGMENMQYAEELVREFLMFRGFTNTLQAFDTELSTDIGRAFQVDKIFDLIFGVYIPKFQGDKLVGLLEFFKHYISSFSDGILVDNFLKLEASILRYYIVYAIQLGKKDIVVEFFGINGNNLLQRDRDWAPWFSIPFLKNANLDPQFHVYFSKEWYEALRLSLRNFFSEIFNGTRIPSLLKISTEKNIVNRLKKDNKQLNLKLSQVLALLEEKEAEICLLRSAGNSASLDTGLTQGNNTTMSISHVEHSALSIHKEASSASAVSPNERKLVAERAVSSLIEHVTGSTPSRPGDESISATSLYKEGYKTVDTIQKMLDGLYGSIKLFSVASLHSFVNNLFIIEQ